MDDMIFTVKAITGADTWELDVLGIPYGGPHNGKDAQGEYFTQATRLHEDKYPLPPVIYYHGLNENGAPFGEPVYIGKAVSFEDKADGRWYRVILDKASEYAKRVWDAALQGLAKASSGSARHLTRRTDDGAILEWPVVELSLFDAIGGRQPANSYAVAIPRLKALGIETDDESAELETVGDAVVKAVKANDPDKSANLDTITSREVKPMSDNTPDLVALLQNIQSKLDAQDAAIKALGDKPAKQDDPGVAAKAPMIGKFGNLRRFDNYTTNDLAFASSVLKSAGREPSADLVRAMAVRIVNGEKGEGAEAAKAMLESKGVVDAVKANELNYSTQANYGDEWVGVSYATELWRNIRTDSPILSRLRQVEVPQGTESVTIPVAGSSPTFYKVAQATAQDANPGAITRTATTAKLGTASKSLPVGKLGGSTYYSAEMVEDSLIPWVAEIRADFEAESREIIEHVLIDGDTETGASTNINDIAGTPAGTEAFMLLNGFRKLCLVTNTANSRNGGAITEADFLETVKLMGLGGKNAFERNAVGFICDLHTFWKSLDLSVFKTRDVYSRPTIEGGVMMMPFGYELIGTPNMHRANQDATYGLKANSAGKVDLDTASNNSTGALLAVRWDQWRFGWKRQATFETLRVPGADAFEVYLYLRFGLVNRDNEASAISYNLTV